MIQASFIKRLLSIIGLSPRHLYQKVSSASIAAATREQGLDPLIAELRKIVPDLSFQYTKFFDSQDYVNLWEIKLRGLHAFQVKLALDTMERVGNWPVTIVDIGDSAGTHGMYLRALAGKDKVKKFISTNLDTVAVKKIKALGGNALLCRAEDMDLHSVRPDLCLGFEFLEHLTDPVKFLHNLAEKGQTDYIAVTVPYIRVSRFGGNLIRQPLEAIPAALYAEQVHLFELSPEDWTLLAKFAGWKTVDTRIYWQYPMVHPLRAMAPVWRHLDFEGFLGLVLKRDQELANRYKDW